MANIFNRKELIGQKVNDGRHNGVIIELHQNKERPVYVKFERTEECLFTPSGYSFTEDGYLRVEDAFPCLRFGHLDSNDEIDYGKPEWIADWANYGQYKFFMRYNHRTGKWDVGCNTNVQIDGIEYVSREEAVKIAKYRNENDIKP